MDPSKERSEMNLIFGQKLKLKPTPKLFFGRIVCKNEFHLNVWNQKKN
jgi:hypothetical protein